jgi:diguanylate cyclase (GGDEF)-like protein/PAS domain S-box-containing protein
VSLTAKTVLCLTVAIALVIGAGVGIQWFFLSRQLPRVEDKLVQEGAAAVVRVLEAQINAYDSLCSKWAADERLAQSLQQTVTKGLPPGDPLTAIVDGQSTFGYLIDREGKVVSRKAGKIVVLKEGASEELPTEQWPLSHPLIALTPAPVSHKGLLLTQDGLALVSSHPVYSKVPDSLPLGHLVVGKVLDKEALSGILGDSAGPAQTWLADDASLPGAYRDETGAPAGTDPSRQRYLVRSDRGRWSAFYADIYGAPALYWAGDASGMRSAWMAHGIWREVLWEGIAGLLAVLMCSQVFRRHIYLALKGISSSLGDAKISDVRRMILPLDRRDEVGLLARQLDALLEKFRRSFDEGKRREESLSESEERLSLAIQATKDGLWDWHLRMKTMFLSPSTWTILGRADQGPATKPEDWFNLIHPDDRDEVAKRVQVHAASDSNEVCLEYRVRRHDDSLVWMLYRALVVRDSRGRGERIVGLLTDITPQKEHEQQLTFNATHDTLTGLANRALLTEQLDLAIKQAKRKKGFKFGLMLLDLDRFKVINDGLGHLVGDKVLKCVAEKLRSSVRSTDTVGRCSSTIVRLGGDEFVLLLQDIYDIMDAIRVAERLHGVLAAPFDIDGHEVFTSTSIGIVMSGSAGESVEGILRNADTALYRAKAQGRSRYAVFDMEMGARARKRIQLETNLRRAIERDELVLRYHPIVSLTTGKIDSFEALVRWKHPELGEIPPDEFIHLAEEIDMIQPIGQWIVRTACRQTRLWQKKYASAAELGINVNLSAKEFSQEGLVQSIRDTLTEVDLDPRYVTVEVTETVLMAHSESIIERLKKIRSTGIRLSIDDFGTGFSSLSYLARFPMNSLKIDLSFIRDMHVSAESLQLVTSILALSQSMNLTVVAEGIEEPHQLHRLRELGCEYGQGFLFSKPLDSSAASELLAADPTW